MEVLKEKYTGFESVLAHLGSVQADIIEHASQFRSGEGDAPGGGSASASWALRYSVNVLVDNSLCKGAPVIVESHPSYHNLLGRIEHSGDGATHTDFTMIRPGAVPRANGVTWWFRCVMCC